MKEKQKQRLPRLSRWGVITGTLCLTLGASYATTGSTQASTPVPTVVQGAIVFNKYCVLCHGKDGMGDGNLPLAIPNYPNTNLLSGKTGTDIDAIRKAVLFGGIDKETSPLSPPWDRELNPLDTGSVTLFIIYLREHTGKAMTLLRAARRDTISPRPTLKMGQIVFKNRCALCHGKNGQGDGKLAKFIKDPPPFNLIQSRQPDDYLRYIIRNGGASLERSPQMPPWKNEISPVEIDSVIHYIKTLRK